MTDKIIWIVTALMAVSTILTRCGFLLVGQKLVLPPRVQRALRYAPAAAIVAIILPNLAIVNHELFLSWNNYRLIAAGIAAAYFVWQRGMLGSILIGMFVFTVLRLYF